MIRDVNHLNLSNLIPNIILNLRTVTKQSAIAGATHPAVQHMGIAKLAMNIANVVPA